MKKTTKTLICLMLVAMMSMGMTVSATNYTAVEPTFDVLVNGERFYSEPPVIVIDGSTYLPLRAMGDALGVYVEWNSEIGQVEVSTTKAPTPKETVENAYARFSDIPDFGKIANIAPYAEQDELTDFGYLYSYGYALPADNLEVLLQNYSSALTILGYEPYWYDNSEGYDSILLLGANGRMINLIMQENILIVSAFEKRHTKEEWNILGSGQTLPQKQFTAETAGFKVMVDGTEFVSDKPTLVVDGRTYLPLRALGDCLGVDVEWNAEIGRVEVTK